MKLGDRSAREVSWPFFFFLFLGASVSVYPEPDARQKKQSCCLVLLCVVCVCTILVALPPLSFVEFSLCRFVFAVFAAIVCVLALKFFFCCERGNLAWCAHSLAVAFWYFFYVIINTLPLLIVLWCHISRVNVYAYCVTRDEMFAYSISLFPL